MLTGPGMQGQRYREDLRVVMERRMIGEGRRRNLEALMGGEGGGGRGTGRI